MNRELIENIIVKRLKSLEKGKVLFTDDFLDLGSPESINKALFRIEEKQFLVRLAHGVYLYPKIDKELGVLYPSIEEIAKAIAQRDRARIIPTGVQALNKLGISTQIPMKVVYLTDGAARSIAIGKRNIIFKKTSPKNLEVRGEISGLIIQALKTLGEKNVDDNLLAKLYDLLKNEKKGNIRHDAKLSPAWINKILMQATK
ncbi:MAG: hypothetical protein E6H08_00020 [Bacteroidetes bacterium]|nr:MAG: hypothetical protein E6H08_00020 [Bacteroidota bacterium]